MAGVSVAVLQTLPIFESMPPARMEALGRVASLRNVPRGGVVLREGENTNSIYFILNGSLNVIVSDSDGREVILTQLGRGELFGEMGAIDNHPRSATVVATQSSDLVMITKPDFQQILFDNFEVSIAIMRGLANRLRLADRKIESLALLDVYGRIIKNPMTKQDMAKMIGASREMVSRVMKDLQLQGLIEETDDCIVLHERLNT